MLANTTFKDLRILLVDDRVDTLQMIETMLRDIGAQHMHTARDGREALAWMNDCDSFVDLILCDWNMPRMSGLDFLKQVRSVDPRVPFLMITGRADADDVLAAKRHGVSAYIRKPFTAEELARKLEVLSYVIAHRRLR